MAIRKILVVDDSIDIREMMARLLELENFDVVTAEDGRAGLQIAEVERPDLIITDINMPNLNGLQMIRMIRELPHFREVPILAVTAYGSGLVAEAIAAGANSATIKPIEPGSLIRGIQQLLTRPRSTDQDGQS